MQSLPELHGNDAYGDNKNTLFGEKVSGEPEKWYRKAETAEILTQEKVWSESCFLLQLPPLAPHYHAEQSNSNHRHKVIVETPRSYGPFLESNLSPQKKVSEFLFSFHSKSCFLSKKLLHPLLSIPRETFLPQQITLLKSHVRSLATQVQHDFIQSRICNGG